ncbi:MAG: phosphoserine phosphatase SerB [Desulfobacterota bacterium]|nr:phosphoserine phosphatase SerB [Thermodesulfobacteriota bacterium]
MPLEPHTNRKGLYVLSVIGEDRVGLVSQVTQFLYQKGFNLVDIEQSVIHSQFTMVLLIEPISGRFRLRELKRGLSLLARELDVKITATPLHAFKGLRLAETKEPYILTILGTDRPGVVAGFSKVFARHRCNIERIKMIARGELLAMEMAVDLRKAHFSELRRELSEVAREIGMDVVFQPEALFKRRKKVIVFDMDSTIVDGEIIDEMAKVLGLEREVATITERGMKGEIDFTESLRARVSLLKGLKVKSLESIARSLRLTKGSEELIAALKEMGFKIALISGGFTYFTDYLKKRLGFDYAFGNELEIRAGRLTGKVKGRVIDARRKAEIMDEICKREGVSREEVVAIGDGSNDRIMVANAGLGIAFNAKEVLKKVADGALTKEHMKGILYCLGITDRDLKQGEPTERVKRISKPHLTPRKAADPKR